MLQFVKSKRRLRDSKDEIIDNLILPFVKDSTAMFPTHPMYTPKIGIEAFRAGALGKSSTNVFKEQKPYFEDQREAQIVPDKKLRKPTSIEMLVAMNMISHA